MPREKVTKTSVEKVEPAPSGPVFLWDTELSGFGVCVNPSGRRSFVVRYRTRAGRRDRRMVLGRFGAMTIQEARREARALLGEVDRGGDPAGERQRAAAALTVAQLGELYLADYAAQHHKDGGLEARRKLKKNVVPLIGKLTAEYVTRTDVERVHREITKRAPTQANRTLALLSGMFRMAEEHGLRPQGTNPCKFVRKNAENQRERYLTDAELHAYANGLDQVEVADPRCRPTCDALRIMLLTGARKGEVLSLRWQYLDLERGLALLPDTKTGQRALVLPEPVVEILERIRAGDANSEFVFPSTGISGHLTEVRKTHERACRLAKLQDLRVHDLRHSFASFAIAGGHSLPMVGKALGHKRITTAERYVSIGNNPVRLVVESTGRYMAELMRAERTDQAPTRLDHADGERRDGRWSQPTNGGKSLGAQAH